MDAGPGLPKRISMTDWTAGWRQLAPFPEADWQAWLAALRPPSGLAPATGGAAASAGPGEELMQFAQRWFATALPRWPAADAAMPPDGAAPQWLRALETINALLAEAARDAATRYAQVLSTEAAPTTLRGLFNTWIDCAEAAFQSAAHSERYWSAQAVLINEFVALRGRQQELAERSARALGQPTRAEVDALHGKLREFGAELAALRAAKPSA